MTRRHCGEHLAVALLVLIAASLWIPLTGNAASHGGHWTLLAGSGLAALVVAVGAGRYVAHSYTVSLCRIEKTAARLAEGDVKARVGTIRNPHEVRRVAQVVDRVGQFVEAERVFVADAAHELRTPLAALRLRLENLEPLLPSGTDTDLTSAIAEADRLSELLDGLLGLARADTTRACEVLDVGAVARERYESWHPVAERQGVHLDLDLRPSCWATALPGAVQQCIDNFVANALRATPPGRCVRLSVDRHGFWVEMHVVDEGVGLGHEERERAFERFWRSPTAFGSGSGLGLAIVRRVAEGSGGNAELQPAAGGGIDAVVRLPMARRADSPSAGMVPTRPTRIPEPSDGVTVTADAALVA